MGQIKMTDKQVDCLATFIVILLIGLILSSMYLAVSHANRTYEKSLLDRAALEQTIIDMGHDIIEVRQFCEIVGITLQEFYDSKAMQQHFINMKNNTPDQFNEALISLYHKKQQEKSNSNSGLGGLAVGVAIGSMLK